MTETKQLDVDGKRKRKRRERIAADGTAAAEYWQRNQHVVLYCKGSFGFFNLSKSLPSHVYIPIKIIKHRLIIKLIL